MLRLKDGGRFNEMSDITLAVASSLAALSASLVIAGRVAVDVVRTLSWGAMGVFGSHVLGVMITAPMSPRLTDTLGILAFVWLIAATPAVCARGLRRSISGKRSALDGS
jgi:hypothetical protein